VKTPAFMYLPTTLPPPARPHLPPHPSPPSPPYHHTPPTHPHTHLHTCLSPHLYHHPSPPPIGRCCKTLHLCCNTSTRARASARCFLPLHRKTHLRAAAAPHTLLPTLRSFYLPCTRRHALRRRMARQAVCTRAVGMLPHATALFLFASLTLKAFPKGRAFPLGRPRTLMHRSSLGCRYLQAHCSTPPTSEPAGSSLFHPGYRFITWILWMDGHAGRL